MNMTLHAMWKQAWARERRLLSFSDKRITCITCDDNLIRKLDEITALHVISPERQSSTFCVVCSTCTSKRGGQLFICISCRRINSRDAKMIKNNWWKCADGPIFSMPDVSYPLFAATSDQSFGER